MHVIIHLFLLADSFIEGSLSRFTVVVSWVWSLRYMSHQKVEKQDTDESPHHNDAMTSELVAELYWVH